MQKSPRGGFFALCFIGLAEFCHSHAAAGRVGALWIKMLAPNESGLREAHGYAAGGGKWGQTMSAPVKPRRVSPP